MHGLAAFAMRGRMQATMVASTLVLISFLFPLISLVSSAIVGLIVLRKGIREGGILILYGCLALAGLGALLTGNVWIPVTYGLLLWMPASLLALVLRETTNLTLTLEILLSCGGLGVTAFYLQSDDPGAFWQKTLSHWLQPVLDKADAFNNTEQLQTFMVSISQYMTGLIATGTALSILLSLLLARWWQSTLFNPGGFRQEFLLLRSHKPVAYASLGLITSGFMTAGALSELLRNISILSVALYLMVGTAVLHTIIAHQGKKVLLFVFYLVMFMIPHALIPVTLIGLSDTWTDWRARFATD